MFLLGGGGGGGGGGGKGSGAIRLKVQCSSYGSTLVMRFGVVRHIR